MPKRHRGDSQVFRTNHSPHNLSHQQGQVCGGLTALKNPNEWCPPPGTGGQRVLCPATDRVEHCSSYLLNTQGASVPLNPCKTRGTGLCFVSATRGSSRTSLDFASLEFMKEGEGGGMLLSASSKSKDHLKTLSTFSLPNL